MKRVLITGATNGIGKATAEYYLNNGYYVIGTGRRDNINIPIDEYIQCDFTLEEDLNRLVNSVENIDILINNVGINPISNFQDISPEQFLEVQKINLFAPFMLCKKCLPHMTNKNWGRIVNVCSIWSKKSKIGRASYSASKFGLYGMSIALAPEVSKEGILVNCISPGFIDTDLTRTNMGNMIDDVIKQVPINRLGTVEEIARAIFWLGSEQNTFITAQNIMVDGGFVFA